MESATSFTTLYLCLTVSMLLALLMMSTNFLLRHKNLPGFGVKNKGNEYYDAAGYVCQRPSAPGGIVPGGVTPTLDYGTEEHPYESIEVMQLRQNRLSANQAAPLVPERPPPIVEERESRGAASGQREEQEATASTDIEEPQTAPADE